MDKRKKHYSKEREKKHHSFFLKRGEEGDEALQNKTQCFNKTK